MRNSLMGRLFSVPRYLSMPAVGINISDQSIKYVAMRATAHGLRIDSHGQADLDEGVVRGGVITNLQGLVDQLKHIRKSSKRAFANVSLPEQQAYLFSTQLPLMKAEEIRDSLSLQMERFVPIPVQDVIFDFDVIQISPNGMQVQVVAIDRQIVHNYLDACEQAGFSVSLFEIEPQSVARALLGADQKETAMVVDFGDSHTGISVVEHGHVLFTSLIETNGNQIAQLIARRLKISPDKAHALKNTYGLLSHEKTETIRPDLELMMQSFAKDIQKAVQYWYTKNTGGRGQSSSAVSKIYFCGGNSHMPGLIPYLQAAVVLPIEKGDPWRQMYASKGAYVPRIAPDRVLSYTSAIGLALATLDHD